MKPQIDADSTRCLNLQAHTRQFGAALTTRCSLAPKAPLDSTRSQVFRRQACAKGRQSPCSLRIGERCPRRPCRQRPRHRAHWRGGFARAHEVARLNDFADQPSPNCHICTKHPATLVVPRHAALKYIEWPGRQTFQLKDVTSTNTAPRSRSAIMWVLWTIRLRTYPGPLGRGRAPRPR
jgi:hypothetical protein